MKLRRRLTVAGGAILLSAQLATAPPARALGLGDFVAGAGDLGSLIDIAMPLIQSYASDLFQGLSIGGIDLSSLITNAVFGSGGILSNGGINLNGILNGVGRELGPTLAQTPYGKPLFNIFRSAIDSGSLSADTVLNSGIIQAVLGQIKQGNPNPNIDLSINPSDNTGTFGNQGITAQGVLDGIQNGTLVLNSDGSIGSLDGSGGGSGANGGATGTTGADGSATIGSTGGATGTGSTTCLYSNTCAGTSPYQSAFGGATGVMGYPNPNEVRGQIYKQADSGQAMPDVFAPNSNIGAYYSGNQSDRDINRATTEEFLSKAGQQNQKKTLDQTQKTVQGVADLVKNCSKNAKSTQELARCDLVVDGVGPSLSAASLAVQMGMRQDNQFQKIQLGNISASMDAERRQRDTENAGMSVRAQQSIWGVPDKW
jgi:hypothetical protein